MTVGVGNPVQEFSLMVDTGSDITWIRCKPCKECHNPSDHFFNPSQSSSYQPLSCDSQKCSDLGPKKGPCNRTCSYISPYADYSNSTGEYATETLGMGSSGSVDQVSIGCGQTNKGFEDYDGVLGLSWSPIAFPSQISAKSFSYCLSGADSKSPSTLEFNSNPLADSVIVTMSTNDAYYYYYVELTGITVGEDLIQIPSSVNQMDSNGIGGVIVDSGTVLTYLDSQVYTSVVDAFRKNIKNLPASKRYDVPSGTSASSLVGPRMSLHFHDQRTPPLGPANYLYRVDGSTICLAFKPRTKNDKASIIGNVLQTGMRITYDLHNKLIGFSTNKC